MVALLHPTRPQAAAPRTAPARSSAARRADGRPAASHLRLVVDNTASAPSSLSPAAVVAIAAVIAMVVLVVMIRGVQGAPPSATWAELSDGAASTIAEPANSSLTVTVAADDTWASIAARIDPGADPVEFARRTASVNGGYTLVEGQVLTLAAD